MLAAQGVLAQTVPSGGAQLQQIPAAPAAAKQPLQIDLPVPPPKLKATDPHLVFVAQRLTVVGAVAYSASDLETIAGFEAGRQLSLQDLYAMAEKISSRYRKDGYLLARAYVPAQQIQNGEVTLAVLEGRYGQVALNNTSRMNGEVPSRLMQGLQPGDVVLREPLEERLLRLSDLPGVAVRSTLVPGATVGLSDLVVEVSPGARVSGSVDVDNGGNRYTGEYRMGVTLNLNNPRGQGDVLSVRALTAGSGLQYGRAVYQAPLGWGRAGVAYSELHYTLGHEFEALQAHGIARTATLFGSYPWVRARERNLTVGLSWDAKDFDDRLDALSLQTRKRAQVVTLSMNGDHRDAWGGGGFNQYALAWSSGQLDLRSDAARVADALTAQTDGHYDKLTFAVSRLQRINETISFLASANGQWAAQNLDASEKMNLGGMQGVRAYPEGEASADEGVLISLEVRKQLMLPAVKYGQLHVAAFVDAGAVKLNHSPWAAADNRRHLRGAGVGVYWSKLRDFSVKAFYARKLGTEDALSAPDKSGRFWVQAVKYF